MAPSDHTVLLQQFREELVKDDLLHDGDSIGTDDQTLLRFLRARQFNLKNAKIMWKNCHEWRNTVEGVGIDELYRQTDPFDYPERNHVFKYWPLFFHKTDKRGRPLNIHHFGRINTTELYKGATPERFWQTLVISAESLTREVLPGAACAAGRHIDGTLVVADLKGFGTGQFWQMKNLARSSFQLSQDYFPETMAHLAIINAPSSFTAIWAVMRPWLAKETVEKVSVFGTNYRPALLELVDAENLPATLGGTCTCEDCDVGEAETDKDAKGKSIVAEMGRCVFSNVGPWMVGRDERREKWLKGERESITLQPGEIEKFTAKEKGEDVLLDEETTPKAEQKLAEDTADDEKDEQFFDASSEDASGPSTPGTDALQQQIAQISIKSGADTSEPRLTSEESVQLVEEKHPETRQVQTGDLHDAT